MKLNSAESDAIFKALEAVGDNRALIKTLNKKERATVLLALKNVVNPEKVHRAQHIYDNEVYAILEKLSPQAEITPSNNRSYEKKSIYKTQKNRFKCFRIENRFQRNHFPG